MPATRRVRGLILEPPGPRAGATSRLSRDPREAVARAGERFILVLVALVIVGGLGLGGCGWNHAVSLEPEASESASSGDQGTEGSQTPDAAAPAVENPTAVGQAVDAVAQPAIADVYGEAQLQRAPTGEALIVSLWYGVPRSPVEGDGEKLRDAFISRGAVPDPANSEMDYHAGEEFVLRLDTGNPAFKTVRVSVSPDNPTVYVNADKSE